MYKLNDDIIIRETDNKALSLTTGDVIEMNETGLYIMLLCKDPISFDDIKKKTCQDWQIDTSDLENFDEWLNEFIICLLENNILSKV